jgi:hypothetical protein
VVAFLLPLWLSVVNSHAGDVRGLNVAHLHSRDVGYGSDAYVQQLAKLKAMGATWVALTDFFYMARVDSPEVRWGRDPDAATMRLAVRQAHAAGLKVLLKPHIWSRDFWDGGKWPGDVAMKSEADWQAFFANYTQAIVATAKLAQDERADAVCIGCELDGTVQRSAEWRQVVGRVRAVYTGALTYASGYLTFDRMDWWDAVDCIGVNAYFPVARRDRADASEIQRGWRDAIRRMERTAERFGRKVCVTELGYSQSPKAGREPWSYDVPEADPQYQAMLYREALAALDGSDQIVGVFLWKWFTADSWQRHERGDPFAIQANPEAVEAMKKAWGR